MTIRYARGPCYGDAFSFSDLLEPPEEGRGIGFTQKHVILADCTTTSSCPPNALRPLPCPPMPASQYLWQNKTIQWLLLPSSLPSPTVLYRDCRARMRSAECKIVHVRFGVDFNRNRFWEKRFRWHNPTKQHTHNPPGPPTGTNSHEAAKVVHRNWG